MQNKETLFVNKFDECGPSIYWINFVGPPDFIININFQKDLSNFFVCLFSWVIFKLICVFQELETKVTSSIEPSSLSGSLQVFIISFTRH